MTRTFEMHWEGELPAAPQEVFDAVTRHAAGWLWEIEYEPQLGGAEHGLTGNGGSVTAWDPPRHFATRSHDGGNALDYRLEPHGTGTHLRYVHHGTLTEDYDRQVDACRDHTAFYNHSLGEYLRHFSGRDPVYVAAAGPEASAVGGFAAMQRALGLPERVAAGDAVRLTPAGIEPIEGVVDYATGSFLGVRSDDALYRFYGRDAWGWPVGVAHHLFAGDADEAAAERAWSGWLAGVFAAEAVA